jgi:hypothetical protein
VKQSDQGFTEAQVTEFLQEQGYSSEAIFEALKSNERFRRAVELFCPTLTLTEDTVEKYYEPNFSFRTGNAMKTTWSSMSRRFWPETTSLSTPRRAIGPSSRCCWNTPRKSTVR